MKKELLTDAEWNALLKLTRVNHFDDVFDVWQDENGNDCFKDLETDELVSISIGLEWIYDALAYPLSHNGMTKEECELILNLFKEFGTTDDLDWLMQEDS